MTKGSKFLNNPNIDRTLSWLPTVAGRLSGRWEAQSSADWSSELSPIDTWMEKEGGDANWPITYCFHTHHSSAETGNRK